MNLPDGWHSVTPRIVVEDVGGLVEFLEAAFGASGEALVDRPSTIRIGDSIVMISRVGPRRATPAFLHLYVEDADAAFRRALAAGAKAIEQPFDTPYGDRRAMIEDQWNNIWQIATPRPNAARSAT